MLLKYQLLCIYRAALWNTFGGIKLFHLTVLTGITSRALKPQLRMVDPLNFLTVPPQVATYCAFDVLCHALESYTAIPYNQRSPRPSNPKLRPSYQVKPRCLAQILL